MAMDRCVSAGISAEAINVLTLYQDQRKLVLINIRSKVTTDTQGTSSEEPARKWAIGDMYTVDSFQGRQAPVIFLDIVASGADANTANESFLGSGSHAYGHITSFVWSPNRFNVAITRSQWGLIVFGKNTPLTGKTRPITSDMKQSLTLLAWDTMDRELSAENAEYPDTHLEGTKLRKEPGERAKSGRPEKDKLEKVVVAAKIQQQQYKEPARNIHVHKDPKP